MLPNQESAQEIQVGLPKEAMLFPRLTVLLTRQTVLDLSKVKVWVRQVLNPKLTVLLPRQPGLVVLLGPGLPMQVPPPRSSRHSPSQGDENTMEDPKLKWVINLSSKPFTQAQRSLLVKGPNLVVTPKHPPNLEYITAIESVCSILDQQHAEEPRANINRVLQYSHPTNLNKAQTQELRELKRDRIE